MKNNVSRYNRNLFIRNTASKEKDVKPSPQNIRFEISHTDNESKLGIANNIDRNPDNIASKFEIIAKDNRRNNGNRKITMGLGAEFNNEPRRVEPDKNKHIRNNNEQRNNDKQECIEESEEKWTMLPRLNINRQHNGDNYAQRYQKPPQASRAPSNERGLHREKGGMDESSGLFKIEDNHRSKRRYLDNHRSKINHSEIKQNNVGSNTRNTRNLHNSLDLRKQYISYDAKVIDLLLDIPKDSLYKQINSQSITSEDRNKLLSVIDNSLKDGFASLKRYFILQHDAYFIHVRNQIIYYVVELYLRKNITLNNVVIDEGNEAIHGVHTMQIEINGSQYLLLAKKNANVVVMSDLVYLDKLDSKLFLAVMNGETQFTKKQEIGSGSSSTVYRLNPETVVMLTKHGKLELHYWEYLGHDNVIIPIKLHENNRYTLSVMPYVKSLGHYLSASYSDREDSNIKVEARLELLHADAKLNDSILPQTDMKIENLGYRYEIVGGVLSAKLLHIDLIRHKGIELERIFTKVYQPLLPFIFQKKFLDDVEHRNLTALLMFNCAQIVTIILWACGRNYDTLFNNQHTNLNKSAVGKYIEFNTNTLQAILKRVFKKEYHNVLLDVFGYQQQKFFNNAVNIAGAVHKLTSANVVDMLSKSFIQNNKRFTQEDFYKLTGEIAS